MERIAVGGVVAERQPVGGVEYAVGVGTDDPHAAGAGDRRELGLTGAALVGAELGEAVGADDRAAHAGFGTLAHCTDDGAGRHDQERAVDRSRRVLDRAVAGEALDFAAVRIDRRNPSAIAGAHQIADRDIAVLVRRARRADHGDMRGLKQRLQGLVQRH
jgi:hypothetical protein